MDYLPYIFDEFSREHISTENKVVGTGFGLPIVKSLIEHAMDGAKCYEMLAQAPAGRSCALSRISAGMIKRKWRDDDEGRGAGTDP